MRLVISLAILAMSASGCASILKGTSQTIAVNTNPPGANCVLRREGGVIATANPTPQIVEVSKSKEDIEVSCQKEGYEDGLTGIASEGDLTTAGNILAGGLVGVAIDAGTGALNEYPPSVSLTLQKLEEPEPVPAPDPSATETAPES